MSVSDLVNSVLIQRLIALHFSDAVVSIAECCQYVLLRRPLLVCFHVKTRLEKEKSAEIEMLMQRYADSFTIMLLVGRDDFQASQSAFSLSVMECTEIKLHTWKQYFLYLWLDPTVVFTVKLRHRQIQGFQTYTSCLMTFVLSCDILLRILWLACVPTKVTCIKYEWRKFRRIFNWCSIWLVHISAIAKLRKTIPLWRETYLVCGRRMNVFIG